VTRGDETAKGNGTDKADEEERQTGKADTAEDLRKLLEEATLRARKLERENTLLRKELNNRRDAATGLQISKASEIELLKRRLKELEEQLTSTRPSSTGTGSRKATTSRPGGKAGSDTSSAATPTAKPRNYGSGVRGSGSATPSAATPAVEQDARDAVEIMQAQLQVKKAELQGAMVDLQAAQRSVSRVNALAKSRAISHEEVQAAEDKVARQKAAVQVKEAELNEQEVRLRRGKQMQPTPAPTAESQQIQEIRKILKELERKLDGLDRTTKPPVPPPSRR
jgi:hypothetical protein